MLVTELDVAEQKAAGKPAKPIHYYAFACIYSKKWYLCKSRRKRFKQLVLLYRLTCVATGRPLCITTTAPAVGGVYADTEGNLVECLEVNWA